MKREYEDNKIGSAIAGDTGTPGSHYEAIWVGVALYDDGVFEARGKYGYGSNQGYLQEHQGLATKARGVSLEAALSEITPDILEWEAGISAAERRAAIRECKIDAEDWLEENQPKGGRNNYPIMTNQL
jgi:hypothetical protein